MKVILIALAASSGREYLAVPVEDLATVLSYKTFRKEGYSNDAELLPGKGITTLEVVNVEEEPSEALIQNATVIVDGLFEDIRVLKAENLALSKQLLEKNEAMIKEIEESLNV
jgi:hypothetical protein